MSKFKSGDKVKIMSGSCYENLNQWKGKIITLTKCIPTKYSDVAWKCKENKHDWIEYELELVGPKKKLTYKDFLAK